MGTNAFIEGALEWYENATKKEAYRKDPALWAKDKLGMHLWSRQNDIAQSIVDNKRTAVKSSNSVGKTYLAAILACWWIDVYPENQTLVISTASTGAQVHKVLWRYIRQIHAEFNLKGYVTQSSEWKTAEGVLLGFGRKPDGDDVTGFQGYHADYILVLADEAGNIPEPLFAGFEAVTVNDTSRVLAIGNPDVYGSYFHQIFQVPEERSVWNRMTISSFDTPAFTGEKVPQTILDNLASPQWAADRAKEWGENSPRYQAKVMGEFPDISETTLFSQSTVNMGMDTEKDFVDLEPIVLGVDVARFGTDFSVVYQYQGGKLRLLDSWSMCDTVESANRICKLAWSTKATEVRIDAVGLGAGVFDMVQHYNNGQFSVIGMVGNASSPDLDRWRNIRSYWYDEMRRKMSHGEIDLDVDDKQLVDELCLLEYHFKNSRASLQVESKDDMRTRGVKSPDFADAAMYACADLGFDPEDPVNQMEIGEEYEYELQQLFADFNSGGSPF